MMPKILIALCAMVLTLSTAATTQAAGRSVTYRSPHAVITLHAYNGKVRAGGTGRYCQVNSGAKNGCWKLTYANPPTADQPPDIISFYKKMGGYWLLRGIVPFSNTCKPNCFSSESMKFGKFFFRAMGAPTKTGGVFKTG